jgi:hypothetical protein
MVSASGYRNCSAFPAFKLADWPSAAEAASDSAMLAASLKRCPDTNRELFSKR